MRNSGSTGYRKGNTKPRAWLWLAGVLLLMMVLLEAIIDLPVSYAHGDQPHAGEEQELLTPSEGPGDKIRPADEHANMNGKPMNTGTLTLKVTLKETAEGVIAEAVATDSMGRAVKDLPLLFYRRTTFGRLRLGPVKTDQAGVASVTVTATPGQKVEVTAVFPGDNTFARSEGSASLDLPPAPEPVKRPPGGLITPYPNPIHVLLLTLIVGGVWLTYGTIAYTLIRIKRAGRASETV